MESVKKLKRLSVLYLSVLILLVVCITATPVVIRHGISIARRFIIEEATLESCLIAILLLVSYFIVMGFRNTLKAYGRLVNRASNDKSKLVSRLAEAFNYIGTVNVEIQQIHFALCGVEHYPQTKKEFRQLLDDLAVKAMAVAGTPWLVVRIISRSAGKTIKEVSVKRPNAELPSTTIGNRAILEHLTAEGLEIIGTRQKNLDLHTVCIFPRFSAAQEQIVLITAIVNQIELFHLLDQNRIDSSNFL
jgi:hypothetical protein